MLTLLEDSDSFLLESSAFSFQSQSTLSFFRLKRALRRWIYKQIIFQKFSSYADFDKINADIEPLLQIS